MANKPNDEAQEHGEHDKCGRRLPSLGRSYLIVVRERSQCGQRVDAVEQMAIEFDFIVLGHISILPRGVAAGSAGRQNRFLDWAVDRSASACRIRRNGQSARRGFC